MIAARQFYAHLLIQERGQPDAEIRTGPYTFDADLSWSEAEDELRENLERNGDIVQRIERAA
jgi:hypothetical protein